MIPGTYMTSEAWVALVGVVVIIVIAFIGGLIPLYMKLSAIAANVKVLMNHRTEDRDDRKQIWSRLDKHTDEINALKPREGDLA